MRNLNKIAAAIFIIAAFVARFQFLLGWEALFLAMILPVPMALTFLIRVKTIPDHLARLYIALVMVLYLIMGIGAMGDNNSVNLGVMWFVFSPLFLLVMIWYSRRVEIGRKLKGIIAVTVMSTLAELGAVWINLQKSSSPFHNAPIVEHPELVAYPWVYAGLHVALIAYVLIMNKQTAK